MSTCAPTAVSFLCSDPLSPHTHTPPPQTPIFPDTDRHLGKFVLLIALIQIPYGLINFYPNVGQGSVWLAYFIYAGALACFLVAMEVWHQTNMRKAIREEKRSLRLGISGRSAGKPANAAGDTTPEPNKMTHDDRNDSQESKGSTAYRRRTGEGPQSYFVRSVAQERMRKKFASSGDDSISNKLNPNLHASSRRGPMTLDDVVAAAAYRQLLLDRVVEILSESHRMDEKEGGGGSERTARTRSISATAKSWVSNMSPASAARVKRKKKASQSPRNLEANNDSSLADDGHEESPFNACFTARDTGVAAEVLKQFQGIGLHIGALDRCLLIRSHLYLDTPHLEEFTALLEKRVSKRVGESNRAIVERGESGIDRKRNVPGGPTKDGAAAMPEAGEVTRFGRASSFQLKKDVNVEMMSNPLHGKPQPKSQLSRTNRASVDMDVPDQADGGARGGAGAQGAHTEPPSATLTFSSEETSEADNISL